MQRRLNTLNNELKEQNDSICSMYKNHYNGIETDWTKLTENLRYASELKDFITKFDFSETFVKDICENCDIISYCQKEAQTMFEPLLLLNSSFYSYNLSLG